MVIARSFIKGTAEEFIRLGKEEPVSNYRRIEEEEHPPEELREMYRAVN